MKAKFYSSILLLSLFLFSSATLLAEVKSETEIENTPQVQNEILAAQGVIKRFLGDSVASKFKVEIIPQDAGVDIFEVESLDGYIVLRGSSGVSACRGLKWYLNNLCNCSVSWRGDNLKLPASLPVVPEKIREKTPFEYRYFFNNCVYGYSMAWWKWPQWERMIDIMALNGVNLPLCLLGQEKVWQETYAEFGLTKEDLKDFFAGPAWFPWQWMGNLDGWGGPLPQSVIDGQSELQKKILARCRQLGMKPILAGFSGHVPKALKRKFPETKVHKLTWWGFDTELLDWQDPLFKKIGVAFLKNQQKMYGTDHYYSIDPFNEMTPPSKDPAYISNMAKLIFSSVDEADPQGTWVIMTWFCKSPQLKNYYWQVDRTKIFFDSIPNERMLALELHGDSYQWTGWFRQNGWYGKPWVWCAIQNFGDTVDIYGGLPQIFDNYNMMQNSPIKGNVVGMGIAMEGLCYNPVVFEMLFDMMWGEGVADFNRWKKDYLLKRYGLENESVKKAWEILYNSRYKHHERTGGTPLCYGANLWSDIGPDMEIVQAWKLMLEAADVLKDSPTYQYDLVNIGREAMGAYAAHYSYQIKKAYEAKDLKEFKKASAQMLTFIKDLDRLLGTSEHFLFGRWVEGFRSWGQNQQEKQLLEWNAKRQITDWGGDIGTYAVKEWSGFFSDYILPQWEGYVAALEKSLIEDSDKPLEDYKLKLKEFKEQWPNRHSTLAVNAEGDAVEISEEMWQKYGKEMWVRGDGPAMKTPPGIAVGKPVVSKTYEADHKPEFAVDGDTDRLNGFWAVGPAMITIDLEKENRLFGFQLYTYWGDGRYYQYTIETSVDGENWSLIVDQSRNTDSASAAGYLHKFKIAHPEGVPARYVRLNMLKNSNNPSIHVSELKVFDSSIDF